jgi:uncharacterized phage-associated protein
MYFRFSTKKTIQAAAVLLKFARGRMGYLRLLKLLYIADRESLRQVRRPIIGTRIVAMKNGPLHSEVFNLVKGEHPDAPLWSEFIRREGYEVELTADPGVSELSPNDVHTLTEVSERYAPMGEYQIAEATHDFPEWLKNFPEGSDDTSFTIPLADLLDAVGLGDEKGEVLQDAKELAEVDRDFAQATQAVAAKRSQIT